MAEAIRRMRDRHVNKVGLEERAWQDSNLRHTAPETVALSPELQARERETAPRCYLKAQASSNGLCNHSRTV